MIRIAIDAMGGDFGADPIISGVIEALKERFASWQSREKVSQKVDKADYEAIHEAGKSKG